MSLPHHLARHLALSIVLTTIGLLPIAPTRAQTAEAIQQSQQLFQRGKQLYQRGEFDSAAKAFHQSQQLHPTFDHAYALGVAYLNALQNDQAIPAFEAAIQIDPDRETVAYAYAHIGKAQLNLQQYPAAIVAYQQALNRRPTDAAIAENLGIAYHLNHQFDAAAQTYEQALRLNPNHPDLRRMLEKARTRQKP
jgi:tetratricopeptide (TPR) repeat protein